MLSAIWRQPHPFCDFMTTWPKFKMSLPFITCITVLASYVYLDSRLPSNATYGGIEYAPNVQHLQALLDELSPGQFAALGVSAGLHMLNAIAYATTLTFACCYVAGRVRHVYPRVARVGDVLAWLQILEMVLYFIEHSCIISQLVHQRAQPHLPMLTNAMSIIFLVILGSSVLYCLALFVLIRVKRHVLVSPMATMDSSAATNTLVMSASSSSSVDMKM
jgi:hypothetical protein